FVTTVSPGCLSQRTISTSTTPSPMAGSLNSIMGLLLVARSVGHDMLDRGSNRGEVGNRGRLLRRVERAVLARHPHDGCVEGEDRFVGEGGRELGSDAVRPRTTMHDHDATGRARELDDGVARKGGQ